MATSCRLVMTLSRNPASLPFPDISQLVLCKKHVAEGECYRDTRIQRHRCRGNLVTLVAPNRPWAGARVNQLAPRVGKVTGAM
eukprot:scaffold401_cov399-Prasinococcus_capsulatus_cf.AAC.32